jgi:transcriptional regulator with XRE-family HTH domain
MTTHPQTVSDRVGVAVKDARTRHGWTRDDLAAQCAKLGATHLTGTLIYDIESGRRNKDTGKRRRQVSADDVMLLALALDVAPVHLMLPLDDEQQVALTDTIAERAQIVRQWARGHHPLKGIDRRMYYTYVPEADLRRWEHIAEMADVRPDQFKVIPESEGE